MSISKVLWEFGHAHWFICRPWPLSHRGYLRENRWAQKPKIFAHWPLTSKSVEPLLYYMNPHSSQADRDYIVPLSRLLALDQGVSFAEKCPSSVLLKNFTLIYCSIELIKSLLQILIWFLQKILEDDKAEVSIILWSGNRGQMSRMLELDWRKLSFQNSTW